MKKRWMLLGFLLVTIAFTGIMIYIRADNNSAVRNFFLHSWHKNYVVEEKNLAYINTTPKQEKVTVLSEGQGYGMFIAAHDLAVKESNFDVVVATPMMMAKVGRLGRILGPKGLMPNPKTGTVTMDIEKAVKNVKAGQVEYRVDRQAAIHTPIGKVSFTEDQLVENFDALRDVILRARPASAKGQYIKSVAVSATFGPGIKLDPLNLD